MVRGAHVRQGGDVGARNGARVWTAGWGEGGRECGQWAVEYRACEQGIAGGVGGRQIGYPCFLNHWETKKKSANLAPPHNQKSKI